MWSIELGKLGYYVTMADTVFGPMLCSTDVEGTILCAEDMYMQWRCQYSDESLRMRATHRDVADLRLEFDSDAGDKVLSCAVLHGQWEQLCGLAGSTRSQERAEAGAVQDATIVQALSRDDYRRVLEAMRFHECSMHAGQASLANTLRHRLLAKAPISDRDIFNILQAQPGPSNRCLVGKSKHKSTNPHKRRQEDVAEKRNALPDVGDPHPGEVLGIDLMFEDKVYLVVMGRHMGYVHLVPVTSKKKEGVCAALKEVVLDYRRNRIQVEAMYGERYPLGASGPAISDSLAVNEDESDNEGAFLAAAADLLPSFNIRSVFVPSGEHVGYVERSIQTLRTRAHATMVGLRWVMPPKVKVQLLLNSATWMNLLAGHQR
jgi:hypothetical protein